MATFANQTKHSSSYSNSAKNSSSWANQYEDRNFSYLLLETGDRLLQENSVRFILEQSNPVDSGWANQTKS